MPKKQSKIKPTVLSCIQPTGELHIGNYFGAIANWVHLQNSGQYQCTYGVVDLHAMTMPYDPATLRENTWTMFLNLLACGIEPEKSILFVQSCVREHTYLAWILGCQCSYGDLIRQTQFKDKSKQLNEGKSGFISAGLVNYPILQAADILIYRAEHVPVGKDQEQHLELSRSIARRFNQTFGDYFPEPKVLSTETPKIRSLADPDKKMSKSLGPKHYIGLFEDPDTVRRKILAAVTDTGIPQADGELAPGVENLFEILSACDQKEQAIQFLEKHRRGVLQYKDLKEAVAESLVGLTYPFRQRRAELLSDCKSLEFKIMEMSEKARQIARQTLQEVCEKVGIRGDVFRN